MTSLVCWLRLRPPLPFAHSKRSLRSCLGAPELGFVATALLVLHLGLPLPAVAVGTLALLPVLRSACVLTRQPLFCASRWQGGFSKVGVMSFVRNRGVSREPLRGLGFLGCRPLGSGSPAIRLPPAVLCPSDSVSGSDSSPQLFPQLHPGVSFDSCGCRSPREGGSRGSPLRSGVLQSPLCHPQSHRGLATGDRPLTPQPFGASFQFPLGDYCFGSPVSSSGGLDGVPRSSGRLPSGSGASVITPLPAVLCGVCGLPVSQAVLRPVVFPAGFHAGHGPCLCHNAPLRVLHSVVPGLLARPRLLVSGSHAGEGLSPLALPGARDPGESLQELPRSYADFGLSGDESSDSSFEGFPDSKASSEALLSAARVRVLLAAASRAMASTSRSHVIPFRHRSGFSSADASSSTSTQRRQPSPSGLRFSVLGRFLPRGSSVVVRRVPPHRWSLSGSSGSGSGSGFVHGRLRFRLGACLQDDHLSGLWSPSCSSFSINHRELLAVLYGVQGFLPVLQGCSVSLFADNTTALSYLRKQGGTHSATLNAVAQSILRLCERHQVRLVPQFITGTLNVLADSLSRRSQVLGSEWTLCHQAFRELLRLWPMTIDLFAMAMTTRLPVYFARMSDLVPQSAGTDAMMQSWDGLQAYAFPTFGLLHRVLLKVRQSRGLEVTLVAPFLPQHPWFPDLLELLVAVPVSLPQRRDLLRQPHFHRFHQNLRVLRLTAFRISSAPPVPSASLRQWLVSLPAAGGVPPE